MDSEQLMILYSLTQILLSLIWVGLVIAERYFWARVLTCYPIALAVVGLSYFLIIHNYPYAYPSMSYLPIWCGIRWLTTNNGLRGTNRDL